MKKLNLYSKNNIERNHLIDTLRGVNDINILVYIGLMIFFVFGVLFETSLSDTFINFDFLPTGVAQQYSWKNPLHQPEQPDMYIFTMLRTEPLVTFVMASVVAFLQFGFVFNKKSSFAQLRSGIDRNRIFLNKTLAPLLLVLVGITAIKLIPLYINIDVLGSAEGLLIPFCANLMQSLIGAVVGYTLTVAGCLFTARILECFAFVVGAGALPYSLFEAINKTLGLTLKGYDGEYSYASGNNEITHCLRFFDPTIGCNGGFNNFAEGWIVDPDRQAKIIVLVDIIWFVVFAVAIALLGRYFKHHFKAEDVRKKAKTPIGVIIPCLTVALFAYIMIIGLNSTYEAQHNLLNGAAQEIAFCLAVAFVIAAVASLIITLKPQKVVWALVSFGICGVVVVASALTGNADACGLKEAIPYADEIDSVSISTPINIFDIKHNDYFQPFSSNVEYLAFHETEDIEVIRSIHKAFIEDNKKDTGAYCDIEYALKDGRIIHREYNYIGSDGVDTALALWDAERNKYNYTLAFGMEMSEETGEPFYPNDKPNQFNHVHIISKHNVITPINDTMTEDDKKALGMALYKDISTLSSADWFYPEEQYGALAISRDYTLNPDLPIDEFEGDENGQFYIIINSKMTNTIELLEKHGYMQHFNKTKEISSSYLVDSNDLTDWYREFVREQYDPRTPEGEPIHMTYVTWNNTCFDAFVKCSFKGGIDQEKLKHNAMFNSTYPFVVNGQVNLDAPFPEVTEVTPEKGAELIKKGYLSYNAGSSCQFLVTIYTDGTYNTVIIPEK